MNKQSQSKLNEIFAQIQVARKAQDQARLELEKLEDLVREINQTMKEEDTSHQSERMPLSSFNEYEFKVYPIGKGRQVYRHIAISGDHTLDDLCEIIIESFNFIDEHYMSFVWIIKCIVALLTNRIRKAMAHLHVSRLTDSIFSKVRNSYCITILGMTGDLLLRF